MRTTERVEFTGSSGGVIAGRLERPSGPLEACALFAHCFTCSKDLKAVVRISRALAERGIGVLRFDFTGLGDSEGEFARTDFTSNVADLLAAADFLRQDLGGAQLLIGHSLGGAAALVAGGRIGEVEAVVTLGAPSDTQHLRDQLLRSSPALASEQAVEMAIAGRAVTVGRELVDDLARHDLREEIYRLGKPLLILHSPVDETVPIDHAARIYQAARHPKSFVALDGADHLLLARDEDSRFAAEIIAAWAWRYVGDKTERRGGADGEESAAHLGDRSSPEEDDRAPSKKP
jgi:putative redox protein